MVKANGRPDRLASRAAESIVTGPRVTVEFSSVVNLPKEQMSLRVARKGRSFLAKVVWWRDNFVGLAFNAETPSAPVSDLEERLRKSEIKKRQLQRRIKELLGER